MSDLIKPTSDRKVRFYTSQKNTFGLLPGIDGTCPGCTTAPGGCWYKAPGRKTCGCYVDGIMHAYKGVYATLEHNTNALRNAATKDNMAAILSAEFARFKMAEHKHAIKTSTEPHLTYRLHWSGDVFNETYAQALVVAMTLYPDIQFWGYTRSFFAVPTLVQASNLILYLSLDPVNIFNGLAVYNDNKGPTNPRLQLCYMSKTNDFSERTADASIELRACPVDAGKMALEGGCPKCTRCITPGTAPVWFES